MAAQKSMKELSEIIKFTFDNSVEDLQILFRDEDPTTGEKAVIALTGVVSKEPYLCKFYLDDLNAWYEDGILNKQLLIERERIFKIR